MNNAFFIRNKWKILCIMVLVIGIGFWLQLEYNNMRPLFIGVVVTEAPIDFSNMQRLYATQTFHSEPMDNMPPEFSWDWVTLEFEGVDALAYIFHPHYSVPISGGRTAMIHSGQSDTLIIEATDGWRNEWTSGWFSLGRERLISTQHMTTSVYVPLGSELVHDFIIYPVFQLPNGDVFLTEPWNGEFDSNSTVVRSNHQLTWYRYTLIHRGVTFVVSVQEREVPFRVLIWEMDDANNIVNHTDFVPWELPNFQEWFFGDNWFNVAVLPPNGHVFETRGVLIGWPFEW